MQNEKYLSRDKTQALIDELKVTKQEGPEFLKSLANKGYTIEGYNDKKEPNLVQTVAGGFVKAPTDLISTGFAGLGALGQKIGETGTKYVAGKLDQLINATGGFDGEQTFSQRVAGQQPSTIGQAYQNQSQQVQQSGANAIMQPITGEKVRPAQNLEQLAGDVIQTGALAIPGSTLGKGAGLAAKTGYGALYGAGTGALTGAGMAMSDNASTEQIAQQTLMGGATGGLIGGALPLAIAGTQKAIKFAKDPIGYGSSIKQDIQSYAGSKSVQPQFGSSVERLTTSPTRTETPLATYNRYLPQAEKSLTDIKVDAPISDVGSKIGDAFRKVVDLRRTAGSIMGQELKTVGKTKVNIEPIFMDFETALKDSGLTYNGITKKIMASDLSKVAPDDIAIIEDFVQELNKAGTNPSVAKIDAILSRVSDKINYAKSAKGITQTTNGERIVKGVLAKLRNSFENVPGLEKYNQARANYAELSDFIDEGSGFLGKTTQSGDFAKDASLAKSAVQSILNNGKKDWLLKLEGLTDYPALDEATLALQAMKDAGDYRGLSLLQTLSEGQIPTSKAGFTQKLIDYGIEKGTNVVAGSPAQRTRAYLKSLENTFSKEAPNTITKNSAIPAKGLMKIPTNKGIKTSNVDISKSIPQSTKAASKVVEKSIPKELQPLAEEARKYKSAEEFVKAKSGNQGIYDKEYDNMIQQNRAEARPLTENEWRFFDAETKGDKVKIYRLTTNGEILPGDNVSIYDVSKFINKDGSLNITGAKMGITKLGGKENVKLTEMWIPKKDLYQTPAGTQVYAPKGLKSLTDLWNKANKKVDTLMTEANKSKATKIIGTGGTIGGGATIAGAAPEDFNSQTPTNIDMLNDIKYVLSQTENSGKMNYSQMDKETGKTAIGPYQITETLFKQAKKQFPEDFKEVKSWKDLKGNKTAQENLVDLMLNYYLDSEAPFTNQNSPATLEQIFAVWRKGVGKASSQTGIDYSNKAMKIYNDKFKTYYPNKVY